MVKALAEMHGGRFSIDSEPDHGTAVTIWLPSDPVIRPDLTADTDLGGSISHDPLGDA